MPDPTLRDQILSTLLQQSWLRGNPALARVTISEDLLYLKLADDLDLDSLDIVAAVVDVEDAFNLDDVSDGEIDGLRTVWDVVKLVERKARHG